MSVIPGGNTYIIGSSGGQLVELISPDKPLVFNPTVGNTELDTTFTLPFQINYDSKYRISWKGFITMKDSPSALDWWQIYIYSLNTPLDDYRQTLFDLQQTWATGNTGTFWNMENIYNPIYGGAPPQPAPTNQLVFTLFGNFSIPENYQITVLSLFIQPIG